MTARAGAAVWVMGHLRKVGSRYHAGTVAKLVEAGAALAAVTAVRLGGGRARRQPGGALGGPGEAEAGRLPLDRGGLGGGYADLVIGTGTETVVVHRDGAEWVLYGPVFADGFETGNTGRWSAAVP